MLPSLKLIEDKFLNGIIIELVSIKDYFAVRLLDGYTPLVFHLSKDQEKAREDYITLIQLIESKRSEVTDYTGITHKIDYGNSWMKVNYN